MMATESSKPNMPDSLFEPAIDIAAIPSNRATPEPESMQYQVQSQVQGWKYMPTQVQFDASKHLAIEEPEWRLKLSDFGYDDERDGVSDLAATAPFRLFTNEAVRLMRNDLLSEPVQENHVFGWERAPYCVRGYAPEVSKFIYEAWSHPRILEALSKAAGVDLVPVVPYEIAHTNVQLGPRGRDGVRELNDIPTAPLSSAEELETSEWDDRPVDDWHYDSVPYVAVLMVSDTDGMQGGETAVQDKNGNIQVVPSPAMGKVVLMQGSRIKHAALRARNCSERIAMVTSLRPRDPTKTDMTRLTNVYQVSDMQKLGQQWLQYRFKVLEDRFRIEREKLEATNAYDRDDIIDFSKRQEEYLSSSIKELFRDLL